MAGQLSAQDIHYTQFYNAPYLLNPALTGVFEGNTRFSGNYRNQWSSVPVDYRTFTIGVDHNFFGKGYHPGFFSGGLVINYDQAGTSRLRMINLGLNGSYTRRLSDHFYGSVGVQLGGVQRSFAPDELLFDEHYDGQQVNLDHDATDPVLTFNNKNQFFDFSTGFNLRWQQLSDGELVDRRDQRSKLDVGIGIFHLNRPNQSFVEGYSAPLAMRFSPYVSATIQVGAEVDVVGSFFTQVQRPYNESVAGVGGVFHMSRKLGRQIALQLGVLYRFQELSDAYSPSMELTYNNWRAGFSYDITLSEFNVASRRRGGPEFFFQYVIRRVKLPTQKICPLI